MAIELEEARTPGLPVVKRTAIGQTFNGSVVKAEPRDRLKKGDDGQMRPVLKPNGNARQELVVTCVALPGTTAPAGLGENVSVAEEGELVRLILKGKAYGDWIDQKNALGRNLRVGDIVTQVTESAQVYDANGEPTGAPLTTQADVEAVPRGRSIGIYGPLTLRPPKDGSPWTTKAEEAYFSLKEPIDAEVAAPSAPAPAAAANDVDPF